MEKCHSCESAFVQVATGRPRKYCPACRPPTQQNRYERNPVRTVECSHCGLGFETSYSVQRFCSPFCRARGRDLEKRFPCACCGGPMWRGTGSLPPGKARCRSCRAADRPSRRARSSITEYVCGGCGVTVTRPPTKGQRPKWCPDCRKRGSSWVPVATRRMVYERDEWTCWLCLEPVAPELIGSRSEWRPSLDHVIPRAKGGSDDPTNLRTAHFWCNSVRCDGRSYTEEDFRHDRPEAA